MILNAESGGYSGDARRILSTIGEVTDADLDRDGLLRSIENADAVIVRLRTTIDDEILAAASRLRVIVTATTGLDHIDLEAAGRRGVAVLSLKGETEFLRTVTATAEHTWALLLGLCRRLPAATEAVRAWSGTAVWDRDLFRGIELRGKRLGIVGLGRIGTMVAQYGRAFQMQVMGFDPNVYPFPEGVTPAESLVALAARSDVLTIHVPLGPSTVGLVDRTVLETLPVSAVVVNTSRGEVVDEDALCDLIENGTIAGAAVDVVIGERSRSNGRLVELARRDRRALVTPHIGGATSESMEKTEIFMARKLAAHLATLRNGGTNVRLG